MSEYVRASERGRGGDGCVGWKRVYLKCGVKRLVCASGGLQSAYLLESLLSPGYQVHNAS